MTKKTIKVRILVAVTPMGAWSSIGYDGMDEDDAKREVYSGDDEDPAFHWITAEVPIPEASEIVGEVE